MICEDVFDTVYHADSVEWCPVEGNQHFIACGTYQLDDEKSNTEQEQHRFGRLYLLESRQSPDGNVSAVKLHQTATSGILDNKWCPHTLTIGDQSATVLATAAADGQLSIHQLITPDDTSDAGGTELKIMTSSMAVLNGLALSLDWSSTAETSSQNPDIVVSYSGGNVGVFHLNESGLHKVSNWDAHSHEAWIAAFDSWDPKTIYSGGDDSMLKRWDMRQGCTKSAWEIRKSMGVTSIHCNAYKQNLLATGSYDESIDFWDTRMVKKPLYTVKIGGGVWRLKWEPLTGQRIIAAAMHNGVHILKYNTESGPEITSSYHGHASMAYGADWSWSKGSSLVATCSFYDHSMHLLKITCNESDQE